MQSDVRQLSQRNEGKTGGIQQQRNNQAPEDRALNTLIDEKIGIVRRLGASPFGSSSLCSDLPPPALLAPVEPARTVGPQGPHSVTPDKRKRPAFAGLSRLVAERQRLLGAKAPRPYRGRRRFAPAFLRQLCWLRSNPFRVLVRAVPLINKKAQHSLGPDC